jgi:ABC-type multidrug transport system ATPase subunit
MITIETLTKSYGQHRVLENLALVANPGEVTLLVGANGCGKTTTMRLLAGLSAPDGGRIAIGGQDLAAERAGALERLSFLPQSPLFHVHLSVREILRFYTRLRNLPASRAGAVADDWGISKYLDVPTGRLSGGLRQRLALAVHALPDAPVLVLDEPGLSLDPDWRQFLQGELARAARRGRTVLVSTHLIGEWDGHADRCLVLEGGRVTRELPPDRLRDAFPFAMPKVAVGPTFRSGEPMVRTAQGCAPTRAL